MSEQVYQIFPLGDSAITIDLGNRIDLHLNEKVLSIHYWLKQNSFSGLKDVVAGYSSVTLLYDPYLIKLENSQMLAYDVVKEKLVEAYKAQRQNTVIDNSLISIPVCYAEQFGPDLKAVSSFCNCPISDVISIHSSVQYYLYIIGFLPGFPYLGEVDTRIQLGRKEKPVPVKAGSVGIAGSQTGIYPVDSPGGWNIIGRTPLKLFNLEKDPPVSLKPGQRIQFYSIGLEEFEEMENEKS